MSLSATSARLAMLLTAAVVPAGVVAQGSDTKGAIPASHMPPPGMCRIWVTGVPADKQPAATDCATALKNRPSNGRVVFGESKAGMQGTGAGAGSGAATALRALPGGVRPGVAPPPPPPRTARDSAAAQGSKQVRRDSTRIRRDSGGVYFRQ